MIIVDPYQTAGIGGLDRKGGELRVDRGIGFPVRFVESRYRREAVEQRPKSTIRKAAIGATDLGLAEVDRQHFVGPFQASAILAAELCPGPADPPAAPPL